MTAANLRSAFGGESMAHMRYELWSTKAAADGFPNVARLFRAIAHAEQVHASNHFTVMAHEGGASLVASMAGFGLGSTSENLAGAIEGELFEANEMYPVYMQGALAQSEREAVQSFRYALETEKTHAVLFQGAKKAVDGGKDVTLGSVHICGECGYTVAGGVPAACPICAAPETRFKSFQ
jgi:rubrerythrin